MQNLIWDLKRASKQCECERNLSITAFVFFSSPVAGFLSATQVVTSVSFIVKEKNEYCTLAQKLNVILISDFGNRF